MKVKYFITSLLLIITFSGCQVSVSDYPTSFYHSSLDREDVREVVSTVLRSQAIIEDESSSRLSSSVTLDGYIHSSEDQDTLTGENHISSSSNRLWIYQRGYRSILLKNMSYDYYDNSGEYRYRYSGVISNTIIGEVSFKSVKTFFGDSGKNPYSGSLEIVSSLATIYLDALDEYDIDLTMYDDYYNIDGVTYRMRWRDVGF